MTMMAMKKPKKKKGKEETVLSDLNDLHPEPVKEEDITNIPDNKATSSNKEVLVKVNTTANKKKDAKVAPVVMSSSEYAVDDNNKGAADNNNKGPERSIVPSPPVLKSPHRFFISMANKINRLDRFLDPYFGMEAHYNTYSRGVMLRFLLGMVMYGIHWTLWALTYPTLEAKRSARPGDYGMSFHHNACSLVFIGIYAGFFGIPVFVRAACQHIYYPSMDTADLMRIDPEVCRLVVRVTLIYFFFAVLSGGVKDPDARETFRRLGMLIANALQLLYFVPRAIKKWVPDGRARGLIGLQIRAAVVLILLGYIPVMFMPIALKHLSADQIVLVFPLLLSLVEFGVVVGVFNDRTCQGNCEESLAAVGRGLVALFESFRVGMLVVIVNTKGTYGGLVYGTLLNAMLESFSRNNLFTAGRLFIEQGFVRLYRIPFPSNDPLPLINQPLPTFKRVYLGCKFETEYFAEFTLFLMKVSKFGYPVEVAVDEATNELVPTLDASWLVLVTLVCGEMVSDAMTVSISKLIAWKASWLSVEVPLVETGSSVVFQTIFWIYCGVVSANSIGTMGALSDQLLLDSEEGSSAVEAAAMFGSSAGSSSTSGDGGG